MRPGAKVLLFAFNNPRRLLFLYPGMAPMPMGLSHVAPVKKKNPLPFRHDGGYEGEFAFVAFVTIVSSFRCFSVSRN